MIINFKVDCDIDTSAGFPKLFNKLWTQQPENLRYVQTDGFFISEPQTSLALTVYITWFVSNAIS